MVDFRLEIKNGSSLLFLFSRAADHRTSQAYAQAILTFGGRDTEGQFVEAVADPWFEFIRIFQRDPLALLEIDWRKLEEIVAGAWRQAGFDEVILTPRSGDKGRDVIATKYGVGSIRIFDQVKAYT